LCANQFTKKQDIEIAGLFAAVLAWGQRKTIINKCVDLMQRMDNSPYDFITNHQSADLHKLENFRHRTFNDTDLLYFVHFLHQYYQQHDSLEEAFLSAEGEIKTGIINFRKAFFALPDFPHRTQKHIPDPQRNSACKRINMYLRWMVRQDAQGVDFGLWQQLKPADLIVPLDLHVQRVAIKMGLLQRRQSDWQAALELTQALRQFDPNDPVKYDFALFGMGLEVRRGADW
jgi:uncharacterized protein (TIGR02757 family)